MIEFARPAEKQQSKIVTIKVVGIGGAGNNTVNSIIDSGYQEVEFIAINTDAQALEQSKAKEKIQIGVKSTKGLGTGANPDIGKRSAEEDIDKVLAVIGDSEIVFLAAGMGGGTGSGALPVIANALRERGILTIAIVTTPFLFEGKRRTKVANDVIEQLKKTVDTLIIISNQKLLDTVKPDVSMIDAFAMINEILRECVLSISNIVARPGHINVDFADVRTIMKDRGLAIMGTGKASGERRAELAAQQAISSPLFENMDITGAHGVLFNITGGKNLGLHEISQAASVIYAQAHEDATIIIGSVIDETITDEVVVTIIATGFEKSVTQEDAAAVQSRMKQHPEGTIASEQSTHEQPQTPLETHHEPDSQSFLPKNTGGYKNTDNYNYKNESKKESPINTQLIIDPNDLDIPTFLRNQK